MTFYLYQSLSSDELLSVGSDALLVLGTTEDTPWGVVYPKDDEETTCVMLVPIGSVREDEVPTGSYNVQYPYTRTALRVRISDSDPQEQLGQFCDVLFGTNYMVIVIHLVDYENHEIETKDLIVDIVPDQIFPCGAASYNPYDKPYGIIIVDASKVAFPARVNVTMIDEFDRTRTGWIGLRSSRGGAPSGSVV